MVAFRPSRGPPHRRSRAVRPTKPPGTGCARSNRRDPPDRSDPSLCPARQGREGEV